jgi:hypothetical protein
MARAKFGRKQAAKDAGKIAKHFVPSPGTGKLSAAVEKAIEKTVMEMQVGSIGPMLQGMVRSAMNPDRAAGRGTRKKK